MTHPPFSSVESIPPELPAYDTDRNLIVWCSHCRHWHAHGRGHNGGNEGNGHRVAHCFKSASPYHRTGYFIRYVGPATPDILKDLQRLRQRGPAVEQARIAARKRLAQAAVTASLAELQILVAAVVAAEQAYSEWTECCPTHEADGQKH